LARSFTVGPGAALGTAVDVAAAGLLDADVDVVAAEPLVVSAAPDPSAPPQAARPAQHAAAARAAEIDRRFIVVSP
jgi:hypothetical protein